MKLSLNWLTDYVKTDLGAEEIAEVLTRVGLEVEDVQTVGGDTILDAEVTTNRPDWLSFIGVAREVAAATGATLEIPAVDLPEKGKPVEEMTSIEVLDAELCPRYTARVLTGVKVAPSPAWLVRKIEAMGLRSVNNVVDITNFVLFECGQPLHAFDYDQLAEHRIIVRRSRKGEVLTAIDGSRHELDGTELMICDAARPVAIGGVMGGLDSEVSDRTTKVLLESARFKPVSIRRTSHRLALESDASYRFSRGIDPVGVEWGSRRAAALMAEICGATVCRGMVDVDAEPFQPWEVTLRVGRIPRILGISIEADACRRILESLGLETVRADAETLVMRVPSFRGDLGREADLIEEVSRCHGYDKIPASAEGPLRIGGRDEVLAKSARAAHILTAAGFCECVTFSFTDAESARVVAPWTEAPPIEVRNPIDREKPALRTSLVPSLLAVRRLNQARRNTDVRLFELAHVYLPRGKNELPDERLMLALVADVGFREMKGIVQALLDRFGLGDAVQVEEAKMGFLVEPLVLTLNGQRLGYLGQVSDEVLARYDLSGPVAAAEMDFDRVMREVAPASRFEELPRFPEVARDLAVVVDETVRWADVQRVVESLDLDILESTSFLSDFHGEQLGTGKKSIAFGMVFRAPDRTLTREEADEAQRAVLEALRKGVGARLRQ